MLYMIHEQLVNDFRCHTCRVSMDRMYYYLVGTSVLIIHEMQTILTFWLYLQVYTWPDLYLSAINVSSTP